MILLDTTVLVYALGADHQLRAPARALLELVRDGQVQATATVEVVQEFAHVRARRQGRDEATARAKQYALGLSPLAMPDRVDLLRGLDLFRDLEGLGPFDSVLAATALDRAWALASADRSFAQVGGLRFLDLSSGTFLEEVRATR
ncbi:MAG: type II toxin-antitoxin system VapC family toxin [Actinobacteria bacterium]|nr:type II toxin-antitoxin system VapC family toxin [Actinomycetota bacterium]